MPLLKRKTSSDRDGCEWRSSKELRTQNQPVNCHSTKHFHFAAEKKRQWNERKYGFCWRSETLVLQKASKLNKLPALSRWHLLGYFLSFFSTVFFFFMGISSFCEQMVRGTCAHWRGPPLQGFFERGGGERRTTVSACERSRGGVNECGALSTETISRGLGMPARTSSLTLTELSVVPGISVIYPSERRLAVLRFHTEAEPGGERKDPEALVITVID